MNKNEKIDSVIAACKLTMARSVIRMIQAEITGMEVEQWHGFLSKRLLECPITYADIEELERLQEKGINSQDHRIGQAIYEVYTQVKTDIMMTAIGVKNPKPPKGAKPKW